jgi:uncharacterized membrane protein/thiol-disulfide isomerase/thioredoxin
MFRNQRFILILLILAISLITGITNIQAQTPVVRAVLFYSPSCPHCKDVIEEFLPELDKEYGSQLEIFGVNTSTAQGSRLYENYVELFQVPGDLQGVPALVIGDQYLVGSGQIIGEFRALIDQGLQEGGIDWPQIDGLAAILLGDSDQENTSSLAGSERITLWEKFAGDLVGNILAVIVLFGMVGAVIFAGIDLNRSSLTPKNPLPVWLIPTLSMIGIGIAGYLAYVEINQVEAVCGPVGNCNTVQESSYATLFGFLPVGVLGILGYIAILIAWLARLLDLPKYNRLFTLALWIFTLFGTLFSIYLTFLEPFVIGATCMWCLSSAVIMTILFVVATRQLNEPADEPQD